MIGDYKQCTRPKLNKCAELTSRAKQALYKSQIDSITLVRINTFYRVI